ncbi:MAG: hypothetical protein QNJ94_14580 [Alphaproteobacteria bacterium]|nr:hypothetical protein [Alphaproteobacteria bacterium]
MRTRRLNRATRIAALTCSIAAILATGAPNGATAWAFALSERLTNGTSFPSDDLEDAVRWSKRPGSLVDDKVRGLGGGVEYAIADDFCDTLLPAFLDDPKPDCAALRSAIREAFDQWSADHPVLVFTDVTGKVETSLPPKTARDPRRGYGAEIDILAGTPAGFPRPGPFGAETIFYFVVADPIATNGRPIAGNTLTSSDILLNPTKCFYLDPVLERATCNHFSSLILHEIGRTLGLGQPDMNPKRNWDNDSNPLNRVVIDCEDPLDGLRLSRRIDRGAAMISGQGLAQRVQPGLTNDDIGARDFLYPSCGAS